MVQRMHELITALKSLKSISVLRDAFSAEICMLMRESLISSDFLVSVFGLLLIASLFLYYFTTTVSLLNLLCACQ